MSYKTPTKPNKNPNTSKSSPQKAALLKQCQRDFESHIWRRGVELFKGEHVIRVEGPAYKTGDFLEIQGSVKGSRGNEYYVELDITHDPFDVYAECECPYHHQCKHAAALTMAYVERLAFGPDTALELEAPENATQNAIAWLQKFDALKQQSSDSKLKTSVQPGEWQPFYVIDIEGDSIYFNTVERYRKKDGSLGRQRHCSWWDLLAKPTSCFHEQELIACLKLHRENHYFQAIEDLQLSGSLGLRILQSAICTGQTIQRGSSTRLQWGPDLPLNFKWKKEGEFYFFDLTLDEPEATLLSLAPALCYQHGSTIGEVELPCSPAQFRALTNMPKIPAAQIHRASLSIQRQLGEEFPIPVSLQKPQTHGTFIARGTLMGIEQFGQGFLPVLRVEACYGPWSSPLEEKRYIDVIEHELVEIDNKMLEIIRDVEAEQDCVKALRNLLLSSRPVSKEIKGTFLPAEVNPRPYLKTWHNALPKLEALFQQNNWSLEIDASYHGERSTLASHAEFNDGEQAGWFDFKLNISLNNQQAIDTADTISRWLDLGAPKEMAIQNAQSQWELVDMGSLRPLYNTLMELFGEQNFDEAMHLPRFKAHSVAAIDNADYRAAPELKTLQKQLTNFSGLEDCPVPKAIKAELRDYQSKGLSWLHFLYRYQFGGILADDMGLGKTLQTLALIQKLKSGRKLKQGALIVGPTSLVWNWQGEAEKFTPSLKVCVLHGPERHSEFKNLEEYDLCITTYGLLQRDLKTYEKKHFDLLVLDEAQAIKNAKTKNAKAVRKVPAQMRLCLTGTPLENHLGELWALMDFCLPGLLGTNDEFNKNYRKPIEQNGDQTSSDALSARVAPFMLRRTKSEVAKELPEKTEIVQVVKLEKSQKMLYESIRISMEKRVRKLIAEKGVARSHIEFLDALLKLRQSCIDPRLVKLDQAKTVKDSAKMAWLQENIPELVEEGRKILIFSQFTQMLNLVEDTLNKQNTAYVKLTGRTRDRRTVIESFQEGNIPVFLISLKAGGAGLNLTAADTVIHVDPWWNPAVENQATDRAYRIGQDKPVFVYKLIAGGTVEEKIQSMQQKKQSLANALFDSTKNASLPTNGDELLSLFAE